MVRAIFISLICASLISQLACAAENRIIVESFANSTNDATLDPLSTGFSDLLVVYLSGYDGLEILYREDLHRIWQELAQSRSGLDRADTLQIGALIQADTLIKGGFVKVNGSFQANVHGYDIATAELRFSFEQASAIENVDVLASSIAQRIAEKLLNGASSIETTSIDAHPLINTHFTKGLGYHYNGLYDHAVAEFMQVIDLDPARADARIWLGKSYSAGGEQDHARLEYTRFLREFPGHEDADGVRAALATLTNE